MKKNLLTTILLASFCALFSNAQENEPTELSHLFPEPRSWDFGMQVSTGLEQINYPNRTNDAKYNDPYYIARLGFFAQYQISERSSLRSEISAGAFNRLAPTLSFQYAHQFAPRWIAYAGIGLDIDFNNEPFSLSQDAEQRLINPRIQLGLRYQATNSLFLDLRYEQDIIKRTKKQDLINSMERFRTITLGAGFKF